MLNYGDKIGITACSNATPTSQKPQIEALHKILCDLHLVPVTSDYIYADTGVFSGSATDKAAALMDLYKDPDIKAIFDISGGDMANELLDLLDYDIIKANPKPFWGYSDLTTIINAIYHKTGSTAYLYQIKNLVWESKELQIRRFENTVFKYQQDLIDIKWNFLQGKEINGIVIGGNIRCLLKLAGTPYMPDFQNKVLFLESYGGETAQMITYLNQLKQLGAFTKINGLLLGTFTKMEERIEAPSITDIVKYVVNDPLLPIAKTQEVGHGNTSKCLMIGKEYHIQN